MNQHKIMYKSTTEFLHFLSEKEKKTKNINYLKYKVNEKLEPNYKLKRN